MKKIFLYFILSVLTLEIFSEKKIDYEILQKFVLRDLQGNEFPIFMKKDAVIKLLGAPVNTKINYVENVKDKYTFVTISYLNGIQMEYWKGFEEILKYKISSNKFTINNGKIKVGESTIKDVCREYGEIPYSIKTVDNMIVINYNISTDDFLPEEKSAEFIYFWVSFYFDYNSKILSHFYLYPNLQN